MLDWIGEFVCELIASFLPWQVWVAMFALIGFVAALVVLLGQPG